MKRRDFSGKKSNNCNDCFCCEFIIIEKKKTFGI